MLLYGLTDTQGQRMTNETPAYTLDLNVVFINGALALLYKHDLAKALHKMYQLLTALSDTARTVVIAPYNATGGIRLTTVDDVTGAIVTVTDNGAKRLPAVVFRDGTVMTPEPNDTMSSYIVALRRHMTSL